MRVMLTPWCCDSHELRSWFESACVRIRALLRLARMFRELLVEVRTAPERHSPPRVAHASDCRRSLGARRAEGLRRLSARDGIPLVTS